MKKIQKIQASLSNFKKEAVILRAEKKIDELLELQVLQIEALENNLKKEELKLKKLQSNTRFIYQEINKNEIEKIVSH